MINKITINKFRQFQNKDIILGKYLTSICGFNATGKSTLLGLIGNSSEIKATQGKPLIHKQFRTEFSEIIKASEKFDISATNIMQINYNISGIEEQVVFRTTWQDVRTKTEKEKDVKKRLRFRIIPKRKISDTKFTESKLPIPTLYLGLSRLFPIGESNIKRTYKVLLNNEKDKEWYIDNYKRILNINDNIENISNTSISETANKNHIGITTNTYDFLTNSAGQDNLGQILLAILSFKHLKDKNENEYKGGILLVDEIEVTFHPAASNKLIDFLITSSKNLNLQIVFTTHNLTLLKYLCNKTAHNDNTKDIQNNIEMVHLVNANGPLEIMRNPEFMKLENDLLVKNPLGNTMDTITLYTEDDEARYFLNKIFKKYNINTSLFNLPKIKIGCQSLISLYNNDMLRYIHTLAILDGDADLKDITGKKYLENIFLKLPLEGKSPEVTIWEYMNNEMSDDKFEEIYQSFDYSKRTLEEHGPFSDDYKDLSRTDKDREHYKKWFNDNIQILDISIDNFIKDHAMDCEVFINEFKEKYNILATKIGCQRIS